MYKRQLLGTLLSVDPLADYIGIIEDEQNFPGEKRMFKGERSMLGGIITKVKPLVTKRGKNPGAEMCQLWIELPITDLDDEQFEMLLEEEKNKDETIQIVAFPDAYARAKASIEVGKPVLAEVERLQDGLALRNVFRLDLLKEAV